MPKARGTRLKGGKRDASGGTKVLPPDNTPTYAELGLDKRTAAVAQQLAALPEVVREAVAQRDDDR
jgi:hypothetical protein